MGVTRREHALQQVAAPRTDGYFSARQASLAIQQLPARVCARGRAWLCVCVCGAVRASRCPVPRSAAIWSADLPITVSSRLNISGMILPVLAFKIKQKINSFIVSFAWLKRTNQNINVFKNNIYGHNNISKCTLVHLFFCCNHHCRISGIKRVFSD